MSNTLAHPSAALPAGRPTLLQAFAARFVALLESMVAAQSRQFENTEPLLYRFPPL